MNARKRLPARIVGGALYVGAMVVVAASAAWPIYRSGWYLLVVASAALTGAALALASRRWAWSGIVTGVAAAGATIVLGVLVAVPARWSDPARLPAALGDVLVGAVTGWKDLITVELPVGSYRNLLVPALMVFLVGTLLALRLAWARGRVAVAATVVCIAMVFFGLAFGRPVTSEALRIGAWLVPAPLETAVGASALLCTLGWMAWRSQDERRQALLRAAAATGVRVSRRRSSSDRRRAILAAGMLAVAVVVAAVAGPLAAAGQSREVLRSGTGPELVLTQATSPLSGYRAHFSDDALDEVLFRVDPVGTPPERIRVATLTSYDGELFRALDVASSTADARFTRVPSRLAPVPGEPVGVRVTIDRLRGIWMPTAGQLTQVAFEGAAAGALADGFYYNRSTAAAVEISGGGLAEGDTYTLEAVAPDVPALADITAPGVPTSDVEPPASLLTWLEEQDVPADGRGLERAITLLRERGYLSHSLTAPGGDAPPEWASELGDYSFQPSAAGHSLARIDALFRQLLDRQTDAAADGPDSSLVAAVGDDEQFAVAASLLAGQLGFPSRVVVGVRVEPEPEAPGACPDGRCRGRDLSAWIEVQSAEGDWVPVDVTPQHTVPIDSDARRQRDPENVTEVRPETAEEVVAPDPIQRDTVTDDPQDEAPPDLSVLWTALRVVGVTALVLAVGLGPFLLVIAAKAMRRRSRRGTADVTDRLVGGWDEYVDAAIDHGLPAPVAETRTELATRYATPAGIALAERADRTVFSGERPTDDDAARFWALVDEERRRFNRHASMWRRLGAAVSLKSFVRFVAPSPARGRIPSAARSERRMRRRPENAARTP
ncbi:transglutaminase domain-containing protein [Micromonospora sp. DT81.3]|uniref:transglutaminase domain-containing protein n=1 Tax=Micromonospora sp. DT81.3 TaxID=3416523 RepID=UPI003CF830E6